MKISKLERVTLGLTVVALAFLGGWFLSRQAMTREAFVPSPDLPAPAPSESAAPAEALININAATAEELTELPGVGEKKAADIVAYREAHGPFPVVESLTDVPGIGQSILDRCEGLITVED